MAADALITQGLELFASGDVAGAARIWLEARAAGARDPQLDAYLDHVKAVAPDTVANIEVELGLNGPASVPAPSADPVPVATTVPAEMTSTVLVREPARLKAAPALVPLEVEYSGPIEPIFAIPQPPLPVPIPPPPVIVAPPAPLAEPWAGDAVLGPPMEVKSPGGGLELVAAKGRPLEPIAVPQGELAHDEAKLKERLGLDDFSGALELADHLLASNPTHTLALSARERCRSNLQQIHASKLGDLDTAPRVLTPPEQVIWLDLDHRTGFLLAQVDGISSYEDLVELSGMDRLEALRLLAQLVQKGVIGPG